MSHESSDESVRPVSGVTLTFSGHTDTGAVRAVNEDSFLAASPVFVVADGMGGHAYGDRASRAAIAAFARAFPERAPTRPDRVLQAIRQANTEVLAISSDSGGSIGPGSSQRTVSGTTLTGVALVTVGPSDNCHWMVFNVGDSRVYSWDGRSLTQLSVDHSVVQELVDEGLISRDEAQSHPARNVVTRALGASDSVDADIWLLPAGGIQTFLICSDGLTRELSDDEIARIMVFHGSVEPSNDAMGTSLAERLVNAAVTAGGADNVTVVTVESAFARPGGPDTETRDRDALPAFLEETMPRGAA